MSKTGGSSGTRVVAVLATGGSSGTRVVAVLATGGILFSVMQTMVIPLLPILPASTGASDAQLSWLVTAPLIVGATTTPIIGRFADLYGKRRVLVFVFALMAAGALILGMTSNLWVMIGARCLQGLGAAFVPVAIALLRDVLVPARLPSAVGLLSASLGIGSAFGVPLASALAHAVDWHLVFFITGALDVILVVLLITVLQEVHSKSVVSFDVLGSIGITIVLTVGMIAITEGSSWGWSSPAVLALIGSSVLVYALWLMYELRIPSPVVDVRLAARSSIARVNAIAFLVGFSFFGNTLITAQRLQAPAESGYGLGLNLFQAGMFQLPAGLAMVIFSLVSSRVTVRWGARVTMLTGTPIMVIGYVAHLFATDIGGVVTGLVVVSAGTALAYAALPMMLASLVPRGSTASANGVNVLLRTVGQTACSAFVAAMLRVSSTASQGSTAGPEPEAFIASYTGPALAAILAVVVTCLPDQIPPIARARADV